MKIKDLKNKKLPDEPGVYFFKKGRQMLYIGKATSIKDRIRSYFRQDIIDSRGPRIVAMLEEATTVSFEVTDSVLSALLLENSLIKKHQPKYNAKEKDDKSYWYVIITKELFPRVLLVRGKNLITEMDPDEIKYQFGPFPQVSELRLALKIIRKIFPWRDKCQPAQKGKTNRACFNYQIGLCPGVCTGEISRLDYQRQIKNLKLLFEGKKQKLVGDLKKEMTQQAKVGQFEKAAQIRNQLFALSHIQDVALIKEDKRNLASDFRLEAYDVAHLSGQNAVGVMVVFLDGQPAKNEYRRFKLKGVDGKLNNDIASLKEILVRRLKHTEWPKADLIVVDGGQAQLNIAQKILVANGIKTPLVGVVKDEHHRPQKIIGGQKLSKNQIDEVLFANNEAHRFALAYHKNRRQIV